ncbi:PKD domain-containing protein [Patescibacteria group bacterium]|nr:MAG: PKD domain-containing protein [Patescibacteria group bacterium]
MKYLHTRLPFLFLAFFVGQFFIVGAVFASVANITQIGFTTSARSVATGAVSESLTVQTQNSAGASEQLDETADLTLSSSSATGEFSSSATTWNPDTTLTMSKNSSNRTFYYKDTTDRTYTITATLLTRTTLKTWTTTQTITVGTGGGNGVNNQTPMTITATSTTATSTTVSSVSASTSAHSGGTSIAKDPEPIEFEIFGGRDRLAVVGAPVLFQAKLAVIKNVSNPTRYLWSFGDGSAKDAVKTEHTYLFPGEYVVVLNAEAFESNAVWRGMVKVVTPELSVVGQSPEYIEIWNKSPFEINLNDWKLRNGQESFTFPLDTIIPARKKVAFPYQITKVTSGLGTLIDLHNPSAKLIVSSQTPLLAMVSTSSASTVALSPGVINSVSSSPLLSNTPPEDVYQKALALRDEWSKEHDAPVTEVILPKATLARMISREPRKISDTDTSTKEESMVSNQTAAGITILPEEATSTSRGFIDTLISWPGRSFRFMKELIF